MSMMGTNLAAGVAQTTLQAQHVARQRDSRDRRAADTKRLPEVIEARLRALEEGDAADSSTAPHIDQQLPEHQAPPVAKPGDHPRRPYQDQDPSSERSPLYKHLDVQA